MTTKQIYVILTLGKLNYGELMKKLLTILMLLPVLGGVYYFISDTPSELNTKLTYEIVNKINPAATIDHVTLNSEKVMGEFFNDISTRLRNEGLLLEIPGIGTFLNPNKVRFEIPIIIESGGGIVQYADSISGLFKELNNNNISVSCYIKSAMSAAFYLMVTSCNKKISIGEIELMQHKSKYSTENGGFTTPSTLHLDINMSRRESIFLGVNHKSWLELTRGKEDHYFTKKEIKKYKLIDSEFTL